MILFIHEGKVTSEEAKEKLLRTALRVYAYEENDGVTYNDAVLKRTEKGKPYFENIPVYFNISHSGEMWVCLMADFEVGIDIQEERDVHAPEIAARFFTDEEAEYINLKGVDGFFDIWVRKEAYVKYLGTGISEGFDSFAVVEDGKLTDKIKCVAVMDIEIGSGIKCAACLAEADNMTMRII